jgi:hypothetical protein
MTNRSPVRLPTDLSRRLVSALLGFGVAVAVSTGVFLGATRIPGFEPLIAVFPQEHQSFLLPISSILIGLVALAVQFYAGEAIARKSLRKSFGVILLIVLAGTLALLFLYVRFVKKVPNNLTDLEVVVIGWSRLPTCQCPPSDVECIGGLASDLGSCWSEGSIAGVKLSLFLSYLIAVEGFAILAGLLVLQREKSLQQARAARARSKKSPKRGPARSAKKVSTAEAASDPSEVEPPG